MTEKTTIKNKPKKLSIMKTITTIIIILLLLGLGALGWQAYNNQKQLNILQTDVQQTQTSLTQQTDSLQTTQDKLAKFTKISAYSNKQWILADVKYLINLADINLAAGTNTATAIKLLQMADKHVMSLNDLTLNDLHRALVTDISNLQAAPTVDISGIIIRIGAINNQVSQVKFIPRTIEEHQVQKLQDQNKSLWHRICHNTLTILKNIFVLRHHDTQIQPILTNVEQEYLLQNIDLTLGQAKWAVLHREPAIYTAALQKTTQLIKYGFSHNMDAIQNILKTLQELQNINVSPKVPTIDASKQAIAKVAP